MLFVEVLQHVLGGEAIEPMVLDQPRDGGWLRGVAELAYQLADGEAELHRTAGLIAVPERHLAGLARRR